MLVETKPAAREAPSPAEAVQAQTRVRIRFRKDGDLRFLGHHDLMHCFERMFRRAELPLLSTRGFNPRPRLTFALSLSLGLVGEREVLDADLDAALSAVEIHDRLAAHAPPGLQISEVRLLAPKERAHVCRAIYRLAIPEQRLHELADRIDQLMSSAHCWVTHQRPRPRRCDIRPFLHDVRLLGQTLEITVHVTPQGSARADDVLRLLGLGDLLEAGAIVSRADLVLVEEMAGNDARPAEKLETRFSGHSLTERSGPVSSLQEKPPERPTSLLPGPLSFDT
jgi:radical SAM-linked protein